GRDYRSVVTNGTPANGALRKLGLVTPGRVPHDDVVQEVLRREFATLEIDAVTSLKLVEQRRSLPFKVRNRVVAYREYGPLALRRRRPITDYTPWTSQYFDAIHA